MSTLNTLLVVGAVAVVGYLAWTNCWFNICNGQLDLSSEEFNQILPGLFQGGPAISQQDSQKVANLIKSGKMTPAQHNALPTIGTTKTSNYRTTQLQTRKANDPQITAQLKNQNDFTNPKTKAAVNAYLNANGTYKPPANFARTLFAETVYGGRMSV